MSERIPNQRTIWWRVSGGSKSYPIKLVRPSEVNHKMMIDESRQLWGEFVDENRLYPGCNLNEQFTFRTGALYIDEDCEVPYVRENS